MKIELKDIGVIDKASIECNGITILTGKNGSGKSTIAKSVTCVISALGTSKDKFLVDCKDYIRNRLYPSFDDLYFYVDSRYFWRDNPNGAKRETVQLKLRLTESLVNGSFSFSNYDEIISFLNNLIYELLTNEAAINESISYVTKRMYGSRAEIKNARMQNICHDCIKETEKVLEYMKNYIIAHNYLHSSVRTQLNYEFNGQLSPIKKSISEPTITIAGDGDKIVYRHNSADNSTIHPFSEIKDAFYISDGCILDHIDSNKRKAKKGKGDNEIVPSVVTLGDILSSAISFKKNIVLSDEIRKTCPGVFEVLDMVWNHNLMKQKGVTINEDTGLNVANEASGAKIFIILKALLTNGFVNKSTVLLFDEPENHLHPEWQTLFAKMIVAINKEIGAKIICVTHSPNLLFAFDTISLMADRRNFLNVYFSSVKNGQFELKNCSSDISIAHRELVEPYIKLSLKDL